MLALEDVGGFDALPGRRKLDEDAGFIDADGFVELYISQSEAVGLDLRLTYVDDVKSPPNGTLDVECETSVNFSGHSTGHNVENFSAELHKKTVEGRVDLLVYVFALH